MEAGIAMAGAGERFRMPDGSVCIVRRPAAESGGAFVEMEFVLPSGCVPPPHVHPHQVGAYEVLAGRFDL
jgi:quercetin dioxygenase-like cupin family protein